MTTKDHPWGEGNDAPTMPRAAAAVIYSRGNKPMHYRDLWDEIMQRGYWRKPCGKTPWHSLRLLMSRTPSRFKHLDGGFFQLVLSEDTV